MDRATTLLRDLPRRLPFTVAGVLVLLAVAVATGTVRQPVEHQAWFPDVAYGLPSFQDGRWWTLVTGTALAFAPIGVTLVFALMVGLSESRLGTRRTAAAFALGQVAGVLGAAGVLLLASGHGWQWADHTAAVLDVGSSAGSLAALAATTATLHPPWRARFRFALVMYCVVSLLFVGRLWDLEHAIAVALGLPLGAWLLGRRPQRPRWSGSRHEWRLLAAGVTVFFVAGSVAGAAFPGEGPLGDPHHVGDPADLGVSGALVAVALLLLSDGLRRGRRVAWRWVLGLTGLVAVAMLLPPYTPDSIYTGALAWVLVVVLLAGRDAFTARGNPRTARRVGWLLGLGFAALAGYAVIGFTAIPGFEPDPTRTLAADEFAARIFAGTAELQPTSPVATVFLDSLTVVWWSFVLAAFALVLWTNRFPAGDRDRDRALALLRRHGGSNLAWMTTWPDNRYWFAADGEAMVAYRLHAGVAVGLCDPVTPDGQLGAALRGFARFAEDRGWSVCLFSVTDAVADAAEQQGWRRLQVAEEAVIPLPDLAFRGKAWQDVRTALNRATKEGVRFELGTLADMPYTTVRKVRAISEQWVSEKGLPEMGFTLGGVEEALDRDVRVGLAVKDDGTVDGVTSWLPVIGPGGQTVGWTLDLMRRRDGGFRPVTEYLIASACLAFQAEGAQFVSLSGAPLARADADAPDSGIERALDAVGQAMEPRYGFRSLHQFKAKFQPDYHPLYLVYPDDAALPRIGLAISRAYLPQGFTALLRHR